TEAGEDYLARIEPLLHGFDEAQQLARGTTELHGTLRMGVPASIAIREVIPRLPEFMTRHPALRIDLLMEDHRQDLLKEGVDVALRFGELADSSAVAKKIGITHRMLAAAPAYLERAGCPATPTDLPKHTVIIGPPGNSIDAWRFERNGKVVSVRVEGRLHASVNEGATAAAVAGLGILSTGLWGCRNELENGTLIQILKDWQMGTSELHAVFPAGRAAKPSARQFVEYLLTVWGNN